MRVGRPAPCTAWLWKADRSARKPVVLALAARLGLVRAKQLLNFWRYAVIIIFVIALIIFGPKKLPELGRSLGRSLNEFKRASNELKNTLEEEVRMEEQKERVAAEKAVTPAISETLPSAAQARICPASRGIAPEGESAAIAPSTHACDGGEPARRYSWKSACASASRDSIVASAIALLTWGVSAGASGAWLPIVAAVVAAVVVAARLAHVLPAGTLRAERGAPALILTVLTLSVAFTGIGSLLPLLLATVRGQSAAIAGLSLSITGVFWALGSNISSRDALRRRYSPGRISALAMALMALGGLGPLLLALDVIAIIPALAAFAVSAIGMGLINTTLSVHLTILVPGEELGKYLAARTIAVAVGVAAATASGGALVAAEAHADVVFDRGKPAAQVGGRYGDAPVAKALRGGQFVEAASVQKHVLAGVDPAGQILLAERHRIVAGDDDVIAVACARLAPLAIVDLAQMPDTALGHTDAADRIFHVRKYLHRAWKTARQGTTGRIGRYLARVHPIAGGSHPVLSGCMARIRSIADDKVHGVQRQATNACEMLQTSTFLQPDQVQKLVVYEEVTTVADVFMWTVAT